MIAQEDVTLARRIVAFLNDAMSYDGDAIEALFRHRASCNEKLTHHPTIQVGEVRDVGHEHAGMSVGFIGLFNGLVGVDKDSWGIIAAIYEEGDSPRKLVRFEIIEERVS